MPRELIDSGTDRRYVRPGKGGQFKESDDQGRSLSVDQRKRPRLSPRKAKAIGATRSASIERR
jgi:hypothetical protein